MPRVATATRAATSPLTSGKPIGLQFLFQVGNWAGIKAPVNSSSQYGFDIVQWVGDHYESILANSECQTLMQVFAGYLEQTGVIGNTSSNTSGTGTMNASTGSLSPQARGGQTRRARAQSKVTNASNGTGASS